MSAEAASPITSARPERAATPAQPQDSPGGQGAAKEQGASTLRQASPLSLPHWFAPAVIIGLVGLIISLVGLQASVSFALLSKIDGLRTELKGEIQQVKTSIDETNANLSARIDETNKRIDEISASLNASIQQTNERIDETNVRIDGIYERLPPPVSS